ncbi:MAG: 5-oxoprolinase subunit PxpB [Deltaproteobacteria bacterium]|nr:5-oxoprolinase subunit PxpB [Deltaproteobacteria bacterium]
MEVPPRILPAGDQAILIEFGVEINPAVNRLVQAFVRNAGQHRITGIGELIPSYCTLLIYYDPFLLSFSQVEHWARSLSGSDLLDTKTRPEVKEIPVVYGGLYGPDIEFVARHNQITAEEVVQLHTRETYLVYVVGFSPGFAAMGTVPSKIKTPRLQTPRTKVPAGSVGIGGIQTGIYAVESPGGWQLIGRTPLTLFHLNRNPPAYFQAGDYARFYPISQEEFGKRRRQKTEVRSQNKQGKK